MAGIRGENYANDPRAWKFPLFNVNANALTSMSSRIAAGQGLLSGRLVWNIFGFSCVNQSANALWAVGVPTLPINLHPLILPAQLAFRQVGIDASAYLTVRP